MNNRYLAYLATMSISAFFAACTNTDEISQETVSDCTELTCEAKGKEFIDSESSRSALVFSKSQGMVFSWTKGDEMTVFAKDDFAARQIFSLKQGSEGGQNADFIADNFKITKDKLYFSFSKSESTNRDNVVLSDQNNIIVDYSGQKQVGNAGTSHLGYYDFMVSGVYTLSENQAHFSFNHLGSTIRAVMSFNTATMTNLDPQEIEALNSTTPENAVHFTEMQIYDSENSFRQTQRYFSFKTGTSDDGTSYTLKWPEQEITSMDRFTLTLMNQDEATNPDYTGLKGVTRYDNLQDGSSDGGASNGRLISYIEIPPVNFQNKKIAVMLKGYYMKDAVKHEVSYVATRDGYDIPSGKASQINLTMDKADKFDVSLKINHMWQHGSTLDQSRAATGDPGYDKEIFTPSHIYYIYCHDGKVVLPTSGAAGVVTHITNANWDTTNNNGVYISTFKSGTENTTGIITLDKPECAEVPKHDNCEYHLYVVASKEPLTISVSEGASEETVVRALTYDIPTSGDQQLFMRDLYSTPWSESNFVGDITDPVQDVILYHVAAKVDLKWNWNGTTPITTVSVNNVKNENLFLFKPTENTDGIMTAPNGYTASQSIPTELQKNGRYVFYLPQFVKDDCKYNVKIGTHDAVDIKFNPYNISTLGGFTSWLRWLKQE